MVKEGAGSTSSSGLGRGAAVGPECAWLRSAHLVGSLTASPSNSDDCGAYVGDDRKGNQSIIGGGGGGGRKRKS
jgi:hypothetical protein